MKKTTWIQSINSWICVFIKVHETKKMYQTFARTTEKIDVMMPRIQLWYQWRRPDIRKGDGKKSERKKNNINNRNGNGGDSMRLFVCIICSACLLLRQTERTYAQWRRNGSRKSNQPNWQDFIFRYWIFVCECIGRICLLLLLPFAVFVVFVECKQTNGTIIQSRWMDAM